MDWQSYEELTKNIYEELGKADGVTVECWGSTCRVQGASGTPYQIDVLTSHREGEQPYRTAIDCKYWNRRVGRNHVAQMWAVLDDTGIQKGVVVSPLGFTDPAITYANSKDISLVHLRRPEDSDWDGYIRRISVDLRLVRDCVFDYSAQIHADQDTYRSDPASARTLSIYRNDGSLASLTDVADQVRQLALPANRGVDVRGLPARARWSAAADDVKSYVLRFRDKTELMENGSSANAVIRELSFKVKEVVLQATVDIDAAERVAWIMQQLFDQRSFAISPELSVAPWK